MKEYAKHLLIRTPLEKPAQKIQEVLEFGQRNKYPELNDIYMERQRIEQMMQREIGDSFNCIDIGCHLGSMLSLILRLAPHGHHIAFEPTPHKARWLKRKFPEVDVRELALGDESGEVTFYHDVKQSGYSGLRWDMNPNKTVRKLTVQCERLDNILLPDHHVDFIKLDVEGGELAVLRGATDILRRYHPIMLFECTRSGLSNFGFTSAQVFEFLTQQHLYSVFLLKDFLDNGEPLDFEQFHNALEYPFKAFNFIAVAKHKTQQTQVAGDHSHI
jgi:FkbM family methyltransferase